MPTEKELKPPQRRKRPKRVNPRGFLVDADTSMPGLKRRIERLGFVVELATELKQGVSDRDLLRRAVRLQLIIVTRNRGDFGDLIYRAGEKMPPGIIEVQDQNPDAMALAHEILAQHRLALGRFLVLEYHEDRKIYTTRAQRSLGSSTITSRTAPSAAVDAIS